MTTGRKPMNRGYFNTLHPIVCLFYFLAVLAFSMMCMHPVMTGISLVGAILFAAQLEGWRRILSTGKFVFPIFLLIVIANPLFNHRGVTVLFVLFGRWFTLEAVVYGLVSAASLAAVIYWFVCYQAVMTSDKFLFLFGQAAPNTALLISMTLGLIPRLQGRSHQIKETQKMLCPDNGRVLPRLRAATKNLSALLTWSMENAIQTADSMKARGYGVRRRTTFHLFVFDTRDALMLGLLLALTLVCVLARSFGHGTMNYYPRMDAVITGPSGLMLYTVFGILALLPTLLEIKEAHKWRCWNLKN